MFKTKINLVKLGVIERILTLIGLFIRKKFKIVLIILKTTLTILLNSYTITMQKLGYQCW